MNLEGKPGSNARQSKILLASTFSLILLVPMSLAQTPGEPHTSVEAKPNQQLQVNWLYGAYVPKDVPLESLSNHQRFQLFLRQSFTTPGVYLKTAFFSLSDQAANSPRNGETGSAATPNIRLRATDNSSPRTPWQDWGMACLGTSLATIVVGARVFGRARGML